MSEDKSGPEPVAEIETVGYRCRLHDDWSWRPAPGFDLDDYTKALDKKLHKLGRRGRPLPNLYHTALAGAGVVVGKVVRWWGDHSDDPQKALDQYMAEESERLGGDIPPIP